MNAKNVIEKLLRGENLSENEIGFFLTDTLNSERVYQETFKRRGGVEYMRTVKRVRGKLYETLWERTATDCAYPSQPYEIKDNPYWQSLTKRNQNAGSDIPTNRHSKVWVEHENGTMDAAILCPYARNFCQHYHECDGNTDCYRDGKAVFDAVEKLIDAVVFDKETQVAGLLADIHMAVKEHGHIFLV